MNPRLPSPRSYLNRLPAELIQMILQEISGPPCLLAAILSCKTLASTFAADQSRIATSVLLNQFRDHGVLEDALIVWQATINPFNIQTSQSLSDFVASRLDKRAIRVPASIELSQVVQMYNLHAAVGKLTQRFVFLRHASAIAQSIPLGSESLPTETESRRIHRAMYYFEIFCSLFRNAQTSDAEVFDAMSKFLAQFAPWEIEQIGCVHDFVCQQAMPVFNDIAVHDDLFGGLGVDPDVWVGFEEQGLLLFQGLKFICDIDDVKSYKSRFGLLDGSKLPPRLKDTLLGALRNLPMRHDGRMFADSFHAVADYAAELQAPFSDDADSGPFNLWLQTYKYTVLKDSAYWREQSTLRDWGYVMWDAARVKDIDVSRQLTRANPEGSALPEVTSEEPDTSPEEKAGGISVTKTELCGP